MSIQEQKITEEAIAESGVQSQPDKLTGTAAQNKKVFDNLVTAVVRNRFNALLDELTGAAAAGQLGIATIPGFSADNIQTALEQIVQAMQDVTQGSVTDGSCPRRRGGGTHTVLEILPPARWMHRASRCWTARSSAREASARSSSARRPSRRQSSRRSRCSRRTLRRAR